MNRKKVKTIENIKRKIKKQTKKKLKEIIGNEKEKN